MTAARGCCKVFTVSLVPATVLCLAIAFFAGFILLPTLYTELSFKEQYALVIDAGSSHSEVYLYNWRLPFYDNTGLVQQDTYCRVEGVGISGYNDSAAAANSLYNCISGVLRKIPKDYNHRVKTWLGATAGMRLLKHENETLANDTINAINDKYNNEEFKAKRVHMNARILSGEEEALSGWITTNYVNGSYKQKYPGDKRDVSTTNGALDMGGASMQISYSVINDSVNNTRSVSLFGDTYDVYVRSYLCYGINEASRRIVAFAVKSANYTSTVDVPCYPTGFTIQTNSSYLFEDHYCTSQLGPPDNNFKNYTITGSSNASMCWALIRNAMNFSVNITSGESIDYTSPSPYGVFYGFSNFYYTSDAFNVSQLSIEQFDSFYQNISKRCNMSWNEVQSIDDSYYRAFRCIDGMFMLHSLDGMGFNNSIYDWTIYFKYQVNDIFIGWSLGYMLDKSSNFISSYYFTHYPYTTVDLIVGMIVLLILCLIFAIFFAFTCSACSKSLRPTKSGYTNIT